MNTSMACSEPSAEHFCCSHHRGGRTCFPRLVGAECARRVDEKLQIESFKTREETIERIREIRASLSIEPERGHDPEDPNTDENGHVWVIAVTLHKDAETLYLCTDGCIR